MLVCHPKGNCAPTLPRSPGVCLCVSQDASVSPDVRSVSFSVAVHSPSQEHDDDDAASRRGREIDSVDSQFIIYNLSTETILGLFLV